jgi:hypothetical protein
MSLKASLSLGGWETRKRRGESYSRLSEIDLKPGKVVRLT